MNKRIILSYFLVSCIFLIFYGCSTISVSYDYDPLFNFNTVKTYDWLPVPEKAEIDQLTLKHMKNAINQNLEAKGFKQTSESPDILVALHSSKEKKVDVEQWDYGYVDYRYDREYPYWLKDRYPLMRGTDFYEQRSGTERYEYEMGTLIVDFVSAKTKELVWRGIATRIVDPGRTQQDINEAIARMLANFPPIKK